MSTVFESIVSGKWAGRFIWTNDLYAVFAMIEPTTPGHVLVVPRHVYEKWTDALVSVVAYLVKVTHTIDATQEKSFDVSCSGSVITGFEVPHTYLHVIPLRSETGVLLLNTAPASDEALDETIGKLCEGLRAVGYGTNVPLKMNSPTLA